MRSAYRRLRAGLVLMAAALAAAPAGAQDPAAGQSPFMRHMDDARRQIRAASWDDATGSARQALAAASANGNRYEIYDAAVLLIDLLQKQGRHAEARRVAETQVGDFERLGDEDGMAIMLSRAIEAGAAAAEAAEVARLQARLVGQARPYPPLWTLESGQRLRYVPAGLSLPLAQDGWTLLRFEPADAREDSARLEYIRRLDGQGRMVVQLRIGYMEALRGQDGAARQAQAQELLGGTSAMSPAALPDLPFENVAQAKEVQRSEEHGRGVIEAQWAAVRGDWRLQVQASYPETAQDGAGRHLQSLLGAIAWEGERRLFREQTMAEQARAIEAAWVMAQDWPAADALARAALPDAVFPLEIARLDTVMATAAYRRGEMDQARRQYETALAAWAYAGKAYHDETLYQTALDHAADIAHRQGRKNEAAALNRQFIEWVGDRDQAWRPDAAGVELKSALSGQALPLRAGDFRLKPIGPKRFQYEDLRTGAQLGLSVEQRAGADDRALEGSMRAFMRDKLGLDAGAMQAAAFTPRARQGAQGELRGRQWIFEVAPLRDAGRTLRLDVGADAPAPVRMAFWIVDRGDSRSILRAPLTADAAADARIEQVAQALAW